MANVIDFRRKKTKEGKKCTDTEADTDTDKNDARDFGSLVEKNKKNQARMEKERAEANKKVLKKYRIK